MADLQHSAALAHEDREIPKNYFYSIGVIASIAASSLSVAATLWGFAPAAAVISFISKDIRELLSKTYASDHWFTIITGPSDNFSLFSIVWSVSSPISTLLFGRLSDRFGRRWFVIGANVIGIVGGTYNFQPNIEVVADFILGIVACTAMSMDTLIGANVYHRFSLLLPYLTNHPQVLIGLAAGVQSSYLLIVGGAFLVPLLRAIGGI